MFRGKLALVLLLFFGAAAVLFSYFWRDLNLPRTVKLADLPDIVVENLDFKRTIDGKEWRLAARTAEHESGIIKAHQIDVDALELLTGRRTRFYAESGEFSEESANMWLSSIDGTLNLPDRSIDVTAPVANYDTSGDVWRFERGIEMRDDNIVITGTTAVIDADGLFSLEKGAHARWEQK